MAALLRRQQQQQLSASSSSSSQQQQSPPIAPLRRETLLAEVLNKLEACYERFEGSGFSTLLPEYLGRWLHSGQRVELLDDATGARVPLTITGLTDAGFLLAVDEGGGGSRYELTPDGNSLDMMQGLLKRKLPAR